MNIKNILTIGVLVLVSGVLLNQLTQPVKKTGEARYISPEPTSSLNNPRCDSTCYKCRIPDQAYELLKIDACIDQPSDCKPKIASFRLIVQNDDKLLRFKTCSNHGDLGGAINQSFIIFKAGMQKFTCLLQINYPEGNPQICNMSEGLQKCYPIISPTATETPYPTPTPTPDTPSEIGSMPPSEIPTISPTDASVYKQLFPDRPDVPTTIPEPSVQEDKIQSDVKLCIPDQTDLNGDGQTNSIDYALWARAFTQSSTLADINCDGIIDVVDYENFRRRLSL